MDIDSKNYIDVLASTKGAKSSEESWFSDNIIPSHISENSGITIVIDYNINKKATVEYTVDGINWIEFQPESSAGYKKIRLYHGSKFNVRAKSAVTIRHCYLCGN